VVSIVVCHRNLDYLNQFKESVRKTIGVPYEIIIIDNTTNKYNIFQAYNLGFSQCRYDIICFSHEDIIFHTQNWGQKVIEHFNDPKTAIIGIAGSHFVPKLPGGHWSSQISSGKVIHTVEGKTRIESSNYTCTGESSVQAVIVDGLWMCIPRKFMDKLRFDEITFSGFHCYDTDLCLQAKKINLDVKIIFNIDIEHFSKGNRNTGWLENIFYLYEKWRTELPMSGIQLTKAEISHANFYAAQELIEQIRINRYGRNKILLIWKYYLALNIPTNRVNILLTFRLLNQKLYFRLRDKFKS
jgi:hypothetical protein